MSRFIRWHGRKDGSFFLSLFGLLFTGQLARKRYAPFAELKWGSTDGAAIGFAVGFLWALWFSFEIPWRIAKRVPFLRAEERRVGFRWLGGSLWFEFGHQPMGTHYSHLKGRFSDLRRTWKNKEIALWRNTWITGHDRITRRTLHQKLVTIDCGRWPGDTYPADQTLEHFTWKNRFRKIERQSYWWSLPGGRRGIPTGTKGKWGDRYDETYGFGAEDDGSGAENVLALRLKSLLQGWPVGLVAEYPADTPESAFAEVQ